MKREMNLHFGITFVYIAKPNLELDRVETIKRTDYKLHYIRFILCKL